MEHERICYVCGKHYSYCGRCSKYAMLPKFMFTFCSQNCVDIDAATAAYANGHIDANEAKELLDNCDLTNLETFNEYVKGLVDTVNADAKISETPKKSSRKK